MDTSFELIAKFVNTHDDGTPAPRATVIPGKGVEVKYTLTDIRTGETTVESDIVTTMAEARAVLGY